ncbi:putative reverse transcriptase domain-containing protein [Tanacetum coccineum]
MMYHPQTHIPLRSILGVLQIGIKSQGYREPGVVGPEYEGLPWMLDDPYVHVVLHAPPSPEYVHGPEDPEHAPPLPDFVPEPVYPEFMPPEDEVLPAEEQPLPDAASPTADSSGYVPESDPEEDPEEDDEEDPEEDPADYLVDVGDDGDDEDESSDDDEDDDVDIEGDEEEEEHPAPADSTSVALLAVDHAPSAEETKPFETDKFGATPPPHPAYRVTARMSIRDEPPTPFWSEAEIARLLAIPSPPPSPLSLCSSPLPQIPSPPLPVPVSPLPLPASPTYPLGYRAAMIRLRAKAPSTSHPLPLPSPIILLRTKASVAMLRADAPSTYILAPRSEAPPSGTPPLLPMPLPTPSPPLLPPSTNRRADVREACLLPRKRLCFAFGPGYEIIRDPERDVGYEITDTWDEMLVGMPGAPTTDETELGRQVTDLVMTVRQDMDEIYGRLDDAQTERQMAWGRSMDSSDLTCTEVMALRTQVVAQWSEITELRVADRRRQTQLIEALKLMKTLHTQLTTLQSRQGPARGPAQPDAPDEADIVGLEYEGLSWMLDDPYVQVVLQAPPSPDYVPGPEEPEQVPPLPDFVPEPVYPEFMPPEDEVLPAEEQPLPAAASSTADSSGYVPESDPEEDPEEDDKEDPKEDPADYPADGGDDSDDEDESSNDDEDDDETEPFKTDESAATPPPHPAYRVTARMSIRDEPPIPFWSEAEIARLLTIPSPPPSPLSPCSSPPPQIPSPPLPVSSPVSVSPLPLPTSPTYPLGYRAAMIRLRAEAPSTSYPLPLPSPIVLPRTREFVTMLRAAAPSTYILVPRSKATPSGTPPLLLIPLPTPSPPLIPPSTDRRADVREACLPPWKRLCFAFGLGYEVGESSSAPTARPDGDFRSDYGFIATLDDEIMRDPERDVGYRITDTLDEMLVGMPGAPATDETKLGRQVTNLVTTVRQDTNKIYRRLDDAQTERQMVTSRVNMLFRDRRAHACTARLIEIDSSMSREAWGRSMDSRDLACTEVMALRTQVVAQWLEITELRVADRRRQTQLIAALKLMKTLHTQLTTLQSRQGPARGPAQPDAPDEADRVTTALAARYLLSEKHAGNGRKDIHNSRKTSIIQERVSEEMSEPLKMETVFRISNCSVENQVKFSTCTLLGNALTWWNSYVRTVGNDIKKLEVELWDLKVKGTDVIGYSQRFQELALLCVRMFPEESENIKRYVDGLPDMIHGSVVASKPKITQEATEIETELMDKRIRTFAERTGKKKLYGGFKPLCPKCNYHHDGPCAPKCHKCNRVGHLARDCRSPANANTTNNQRGTGTGQKPTCYECDAQGYFKRECQKLKNNNNRGNPAGNVNASAKVYAVGHAGTKPYSNVMTGTDIQEKDKKKAKNDQTKHGMEKTKSNRSQSQSKSESQPRQSQKSTK